VRLPTLGSDNGLRSRVSPLEPSSMRKPLDTSLEDGSSWRPAYSYVREQLCSLGCLLGLSV
jgi:hypothetical protein